MLKGIDPALNADVLHALRAMGHGDTVAICDINYPADSTGRQTTLGHPLHMHGCSVAQAVRAVLSVMPLDTFIDDAAIGMQVVDSPTQVLPVHQDIQAQIEHAHGQSRPLTMIDRMAFYEHAKNAYCVIACSERRFYGNVILSKGVIGPDE